MTRKPRSAPQSESQPPQPVQPTATEPVIVSLGLAHVYLAPAVTSPDNTAAIAGVQDRLTALESRITNLVEALALQASPKLRTSLADAENQADVLHNQLSALRAQPPARERFVQAFCVVTQGNRVLKLTPIAQPGERLDVRERLAIVQRDLMNHNLDLSKLADDLAARNYTAPHEMGPVVAVGVAQSAGDFRAYRVVVEGNRVTEQLPLSPPTSKPAAFRKFRAGLLAVSVGDLDAGIYLADAAKRAGLAA